MPSIGARVGPYEITGVLGAGGMGEVFRARDTKLLRDVAIKVLPESLASDPERRARFEREAQVLASLNHPNIGGIHGFEEVPADGGHPAQALILELVEGPTLADRIADGPVALDEALPIARQIAEALEAAHELGVIHRDLKPANIKLRPDGVVKVLDFGLATLVEGPPKGGRYDQGRSVRLPDHSQSPTITTPAMTQIGLILGTAAYMSPEQARGRVVDRRADVWAFGCVLFEVLTGARAFGGDDVTDTIAAVVRAEPEWSRLPAATPPSIRRLLRRCLAKDVRARPGDMSSARLDIADAGDVAADAPTAAASGPRTPLRSPRLAWLVAAVSSIALVALAVFVLGRTATRPSAVRFELAMPGGVALTRSASHTDIPGVGPGSIAVSPDGSHIAFLASRNGRSHLQIRPIGSFESREIAGTEGATGPFWSPDSKWIGFFSAGSVRKVEAEGGSPQPLCPADAYMGGTWGPDNVILFASSRVIKQVSASGGEVKSVTTLGDKELTHGRPTFLPDSTRFAYASAPSMAIYIASLGSDTRSTLLPPSPDGAMSVSFSRDSVLFLRGTALMAQRFDFSRETFAGDPVLIATDVERPAAVGLFSSSLGGVLAYQSGRSSEERELTWIDRFGRRTPVLSTRANYDDIEISPDDSKAALTLRDGDGRDIWILDLRRGVMDRFTSTPATEQNVVWSPDQSWLAFGVNGEGIFQKRVDRAESPRLVLNEKTLRTANPSSWSPDGRILLLNVGTPLNVWQLLLAGDPKPAPFVQSRATALGAQFSPDGRWVSYHSSESGRNEVFVTPFPGPGERTLVSTAGGQDARWKGDGGELYYTSADGNVVGVTVDGRGPTFNVIGAATVLFPFRKPSVRWPYDVTKDGKRFLVITAVDQAPTPMSVIVNWTSELDTQR